MGMALFWYYLSSVVTGLHIVALCVALPTLVALVALVFDMGESHTKHIKKAVIALAISGSILVFIPRYTFFYALAGYEASKYISNTEIGTKVQDLIIKKLEESVDDKK